jgi:hypothetical protein
VTIEQRLAEMRDRSERATPGPWVADVQQRGDCVVWGPDGAFLSNAQAEPHWLPAPDGSKRMVQFDVDRRDVEFIAHARTDLDDLRGAVDDVLAFLSQYDNANSLRCGVCSGHSPSWDGHSGCATAAIDRLRAAITARLGGAR